MKFSKYNTCLVYLIINKSTNDQKSLLLIFMTLIIIDYRGIVFPPIQYMRMKENINSFKFSQCLPMVLFVFQVQGLDYSHLFPVVQWLVRKEGSVNISQLIFYFIFIYKHYSHLNDGFYSTR